MSAFSWDDENVAHLAERHPDVAPGDVDSIWELPTIRLTNSKGRTGVLFLGIDRKARLLAVPADPTGQDEVWRPRTAHEVTVDWQRQAYYGADTEVTRGEQDE
jgi:hypothetical protein